MAEYTQAELDHLANDMVELVKVISPGAKLNHWYLSVGKNGCSLVALVDLPDGNQSREYCAL